jgi:hypothetical protein
MIFGFTGTRDGMTQEQRKALHEILYFTATGNDEFHHGDCIGADAEAHDMAREFAFYIVVHPPVNGTYRAYKQGDLVLPPRPYLVRNREIVRAATLVVGAPKEASGSKGGTWYTLWYAQQHRQPKPVRIIAPDGTITEK